MIWPLFDLQMQDGCQVLAQKGRKSSQSLHIWLMKALCSWYDAALCLFKGEDHKLHWTCCSRLWRHRRVCPSSLCLASNQGWSLDQAQEWIHQGQWPLLRLLWAWKKEEKVIVVAEARELRTAQLKVAVMMNGVSVENQQVLMRNSHSFSSYHHPRFLPDFSLSPSIYFHLTHVLLLL